jgi:uncharacterized protein with HEPN domain
MPLNEDDLSLLIDIIECIEDINEFTKSIEFHQFEKDKMRKLAVERQLEIIGQAANKIRIETQKNLASIPWKNIIGLRNKLAHDYGEILAERIWKISQDPIHELYKNLQDVEEIKEYMQKRKD